VNRPASLTLICLAALAAPLTGQHVQSIVNGAGAGDKFGHALALDIDLDADGGSDWVVGIPGHDIAPNLGGGRVRAYSGKTGATLWTVSGSVLTNLGWAVAGMPDVNGDGRDDVAVSNPLYDSNGLTNNGRVQILSGLNGSVLLTIAGTQNDERMGESLACPGDLNGDGVADLAVGSPYYNVISGFATLFDAGRVRAVSGATGSVLWTASGDEQNLRFGWKVCAAGTYNAGTTPDVVVAAYGTQASAQGIIIGHPEISVRSGLSGNQLGSVIKSPGTALVVAALGDTNLDGYTDVGWANLKTTEQFGFPPTYTYTWSWGIITGPSGDIVEQESSSIAQANIPTAVLPAGDVNRDGARDYALVRAATVEIRSGATQELLWDDVQASGSVGGFAGDLDGDGWDDLILGDPTNSPSGKVDAGRVTLLDTLYLQKDLGFGGPGSAKLAGYGMPLASGQVCDLVLTGAKPNAPALMLFSLAQAPVAFKGGTLVPSGAALFSFALQTSPSGAIPIVGVPGGLGPANIYVQYAIADGAQPFGVALSNAVRLAFLP